MNKFIFALSTVLFSTQVFAAATLHIPLTIEANDKNSTKYSIAVLNKKLKAQGKATFPEYIDVSTTDNKPWEMVRDVTTKIETAISDLGLDSQYSLVMYSVPTEGDVGNYRTCYTGNPFEVAGIAATLTDSLYSDQLQLRAMKYKNTTKSLDRDVDLNDADTRDFLNNGSDLWKNWNSKNEDLLILSSTGDGGDDIQESLIQKCQ